MSKDGIDEASSPPIKLDTSSSTATTAASEHASTPAASIFTFSFSTFGQSSEQAGAVPRSSSSTLLTSTTASSASSTPAFVFGQGQQKVVQQPFSFSFGPAPPSSPLVDGALISSSARAVSGKAPQTAVTPAGFGGFGVKPAQSVFSFGTALPTFGADVDAQSTFQFGRAVDASKSFGGVAAVANGEG